MAGHASIYGVSRALLLRGFGGVLLGMFCSPGRLPAMGLKVCSALQVPAPNAGLAISLRDAKIADSADSDYELFRRAAVALQISHASRLEIPAKVYVIHAPPMVPASGAMVDLSGLKNVTIEGNGAVIRFEGAGYTSGIRLARDQNVVLRDIDLEWDSPIAFRATLWHARPSAGSSAAYTTLKLAAPWQGRNPQITAVMPYDFSNMRFARTNGELDHTFPCVNGVGLCPQLRTDHSFALPTESWLLGQADHVDVLATIRQNGFADLRVTGGSTGITLRRISIHSSPGVGISVTSAGLGIRIVACDITAADGAESNSLHVLSTAADGIDVIGARGDIEIDSTRVTSSADDGLNVRGLVKQVASVTSNGGVITVREPTNNAFSAGDTITLFSVPNFLTVLQTTLDRVSRRGQMFELTLHRSVSLRPIRTPLFVASGRLASAHYTVQHSTFENTNNRGAVLRSPDGVFRHNQIARTRSSGLEVGMSPITSFVEGPIPRNIAISGNQISETNLTSFTSPIDAPIAAILVYPGSRALASSVTAIKNIRIADNKITDFPSIGIGVYSSDSVAVLRNEICKSTAARNGHSTYPQPVTVVTKWTHSVSVLSNIGCGRQP